MFIDPKKLLISIAKATAKITIAGFIIGIFHEYVISIAILLFLKVVHSIYDLGFKNGQRNWIVPIGMFVTGVIGLVSEDILVDMGFWEYHDISQKLPYWLFFAWMLAFSFIYKLEKELFNNLKNNSLVDKIIITFLIALIFPAFGEVITIYLGVWTYYLPYKILGVPLFAFACLISVHMSVNAVLYSICKSKNIADPVFNPR